MTLRAFDIKIVAHADYVVEAKSETEAVELAMREFAKDTQKRQAGYDVSIKPEGEI